MEGWGGETFPCLDTCVLSMLFITSSLVSFFSPPFAAPTAAVLDGVIRLPAASFFAEARVVVKEYWALVAGLTGTTAAAAAACLFLGLSLGLPWLSSAETGAGGSQRDFLRGVSRKSSFVIGRVCFLFVVGVRTSWMRSAQHQWPVWQCNAIFIYIALLQQWKHVSVDK